MATFFIGDVHGCGDELEELLSFVEVDRVIFIGDLFTKGPNPQKVWQLIQKVKGEGVLGNHDDWMLRKQIWLGLSKEAIQWLEELPLFIEGDAWIAVHAGLHPHGKPTSRKQALVLRRWPDDHAVENPFWWEGFQGEKLVIYGHDAARGVQDHRPFTLGLDSGCVYGGRLTGFLLEENRIVQVKAKKAYRAIKN